MKRTIFLMLAVLLSTLSASAYDFKVDGIAYDYNTHYSSTATSCYVVSGSDKKNAISIPSRVTSGYYTLPVIRIASDAFKDYTNLTSVTIPSTITSIAGDAFSGCTGLTSVTFNAENYASPSYYVSPFKDCPLTSLVIGNNVKSIPDYLAYGLTRLKTITIPNSVTKIGYYAFEGCNNLKYLKLKSSTPPTIVKGSSIPYKCVICVPFGSLDTYRNNAQWRTYALEEGDFPYVTMGNDKGGGSFGGSGSGTKADPYLIFNPIQLHNIRNFTGYDDVYFKLMSDIDLTEFIDDNSPTEGWEPIGSVQSPFIGNLDGDGHTISGIRIDRKADYVGFFSCVKNASISNLKIEGSTIKGNSHVGAFIGATDNSVINGVSASFNNVDGQKFTAGLIGSAQDGCHITSAQYTGAVNVTSDYVGGLVSWAYDNVSISKSTVNATSIVGKGDYVGGLVGFSFELLLSGKTFMSK